MPPEDRAGSRLPGLLFFLVFPLTLILAINIKVDLAKLLWFDETIVSHTALQPTLAGLWKILASGQSPHPPLNFLAVRGVYALFGVSDLTTRLPATAGFALMEVCLFFFVAKRSNAAFGTAAMAFPLVTLARLYAVEAKPYGAILGWTGLALLSWRYTARGQPRRGWALAALGTALTCAVSSHFFGALLSLPILAGESVRWIQRRRVDWLSVAVISLSYWPLLLFIPILKASKMVHGEHPWQRAPGLGFILNSGDRLLAEAAAPVLLCVLIAAASMAWRKARVPAVAAFPLDEIVAASTLALLPVAVFCGFGLAGIRIIDSKYLLPMVVGIAVLFTWTLYQVSARSLAIGVVLASVLGLWGGRDFIRDLRGAQEERFEIMNFSPPPAVRALGDLPIVLETPLFTTVESYAPPAIAERIHFLLSPGMQLKYTGNDALHRSMLLNPRFFGRHVEPMKDFESAHRRFLIYERIPADTTFLIQKYKDDGASLELISGDYLERWYLVQLRPVQLKSEDIKTVQTSRYAPRSDKASMPPAPGCCHLSADSSR